MKDKHKAKRKDYTDSAIMDALDAANYSLTEAARFLGVSYPTLRNWVLKSDNLGPYMRNRQADQAIRAREALDEILNAMDAHDPRQASILKDTAKILLDKFEATKLDITSDNTHKVSVDKELDDKLKELLGDD